MPREAQILPEMAFKSIGNLEIKKCEPPLRLGKRGRPYLFTLAPAPVMRCGPMRRRRRKGLIEPLFYWFFRD